VLRRMFFLPSGFNVETHVRHCLSPGSAVMHPMRGRLDDVPVPRKINSISLVVGFSCCDIDMCENRRGPSRDAS
jgi:hypothetical protein